MSIRTRDEILESVRSRLGDNTDDESIAFLEDITDTLNDYETRIAGGGIDWKARYEENDATWRKKYTDRFYNNESEQEPNKDPEPDKVPKNFADLFTEE